MLPRNCSPFFKNVKLSQILRKPFSSRILHITDCEGNLSSVNAAFNGSKTVKFHSDKGLDFYNSKEKPYFIFGGDATDRGNNDLALVEMLLDFKSRYPEQVFLLVGNRDITKNRFSIELDPKLIRQRLLHSSAPRWLLQHPTVPLDYVRNYMEKQHYKGTASDFIHSLSIEQCQLIYLKWMLEKTMGCPNTFRYRKEELAKNKLDGTISDRDVLTSFLGESSPTGLYGQYLQQAQVGVIIPNTRVLAVHGGLQPNNIGRIPGMDIEDRLIVDANQWINQFNSWYHNEIQLWSNYNSSNLEEPAFSRLDECVLPIPGAVKSIITADMLDSDRQFENIPVIVANYLRKNRIDVVLTGHQPCGDHPAIIREKDLLFINGDTGYAAFNPNSIDDTRGRACHTLEILADEHETQLMINATLSDKSLVKTKLLVRSGRVEGDPYIGLVTPKHQIVQCRLADGNYRTAYQRGFTVAYNTMSPARVADIFSRDIERVTCRIR